MESSSATAEKGFVFMKRPLSKIRCALYLRTPCNHQVPGELSPIEQQELLCRAAAAKHGWQVLEQFVYRDTNDLDDDSRPALNSLLRVTNLQPRPFECIMVADITRLSRNLAEMVRIANGFTSIGMFVYCVDKEMPLYSKNNRSAIEPRLLSNGQQPC